MKMGALDFIGNIVTGGFDIVGNIGGAVGSGLEKFSSGFFPSPQRQTPITTSQQSPVTHSWTSYRPTSAQPASVLETAAQAALNWIDSPYENQFGPSQVMQQTINEPNLGSIVMNPIESLWNTAGKIGAQISDQLPDLLLRKWGLLPEPQQQNSQGDVVYHVYPDPNLPQPNTVPAGQAGQPKGTYDLGFLMDWLKVPAANIPVPSAAQVQQAAGISAKTIALIAVIAALYFAFKKV